MLILNEQHIANLASPVSLTEKMEAAMKAYAVGDFIMPDRMHLDFDGNTLLLMPAASGAYFGTKLVSLFPNNPKSGKPVLYGVVVLNDGESGQPIALFNGAKLTAVRTAAVSCAGIKYLSRPDASSLGVIGAGVQAFHQAVFAAKIRPIDELCVFDPFVDKLDDFIQKLQNELPEVKICVASSSSELCEKSEIIITATNSNSPVLPNEEKLLKNKCVVAIGSYKPEMVELPDLLFKLIDQVYIDVDMALEESGDLINPLNSGLIQKDQIRLISEAFIDEMPRTGTQLYKSVGMALFDLFTADYLYQEAIDKGHGQRVDF